MSKRNLKATTAFLLCIGLGILLFMFLSSLQPSDRAEAERESWNTPPVSDLTPGQVLVRDVSQSEVREFNGGWSPNFGKRDVLIRDYDGTYYSYRFPTWDGAVVMPRIAWGQWEGNCVDIGPATVEGVLTEKTTIQCNSSDFQLYEGIEPKWSLEGKSLVNPFPDLPKLRCKGNSMGNLTCY